jgi:hypothetical protein
MARAMKLRCGVTVGCTLQADVASERGLPAQVPSKAGRMDPPVQSLNFRHPFWSSQDLMLDRCQIYDAKARRGRPRSSLITHLLSQVTIPPPRSFRF